MLYHGSLTQYNTLKRRAKLLTGQNGAYEISLKSIGDDQLVKRLLSLSWQYSFADLTLSIACPVTYTTSWDNSDPVDVRADGTPAVRSAPKFEEGYIKNCGMDIERQNCTYHYTSSEGGWPPFSAGIGFSSAFIADPGLAHYIAAKQEQAVDFWYKADIRVRYVKTNDGQCMFVIRSEDPETCRKLSEYDVPEEKKAFDAWMQMFRNGTEDYLGSHFAESRKNVNETDRQSMQSAVIAELEDELKEQMKARDGALAADIMQTYWPQLEDNVQRSLVWERFEKANASLANALAAKLLRMALLCYEGEYLQLLRLCADAHLYSLGHRLALLLGKQDAACQFAAYNALEQSGVDVLDVLLEVTRRTHNADMLCRWMEDYAYNLQVDNIADAVIFVSRCYNGLSGLLQEDGIKIPDAATLHEDQLASLQLIGDVQRQMSRLAGYCRHEKTKSLCYEMDSICVEMTQTIVNDGMQRLQMLFEMTEDHFNNEKPTLEQLLQNKPEAAGDPHAREYPEDNPFYRVRKMIDDAAAGAAHTGTPAAPEQAEPEAPAATFEDLLRQVNEHFKAGEAYRLPNEGDQTMAPILEKLLTMESNNLDGYRMPLLIYACIRPEKAIGCVEAYQNRIQNKKGRKYQADRRWKLCQLMLALLRGETADLSAPGASVLEAETPFLAEMIRRVAK